MITDWECGFERILKKNFGEMDKSELIKVKRTSSVVAGCLYGVGMFLWDKIANNLDSCGSYLFRALLFSVGWYFIFWPSLLKIRKK